LPGREKDTLPLEEALRAELSRIADEGGRLPAERELAARFGVGRTRLRRALAVLERDGLLFRRHGQGTFTMPPPLPGGSLKSLARSVTPADVMEVRMEVEPALAALAAERATAEDARTLRDLMAGTLTAQTPESYEIADAIFHFRIAELARNPLFLRVYDQIRSIREQSDWAAWRGDRLDSARIAELGQQHQALVDRISVHDSAGAARAMERHLLSIAYGIRRRG
jgi:DNA-binding FadR family transcriptional regulator